MKKALVLSAVLVSFSSLSFAASLNSLSKDQVVGALENQTITTIPLATLESELIADPATIYFDKNNQISGKFAHKPGNDPQTDQGTWTVKDDGSLCITWKHWFKSVPFCDYVYEANNSLLFIKGDNTFASLVLKKNIKSGNHLK